MIEKHLIEQVVQEQRTELINNSKKFYCCRNEEKLVDMEMSTQAQVVLGVRRSGKSVLGNNVLRENLDWRLETQVFLELLRRNRPIERDIYYFRTKGGSEADFVVCKDKEVQEIYQVSYDISKPKTLNREIRGLLAASNETNCNNLFLITYYDRKTISAKNKTIKVIPVHEWLLKQPN